MGAYVGIMEKKMETTIMGSQKPRRPDKSQKTTESEMEVRLLGFPIRLWSWFLLTKVDPFLVARGDTASCRFEYVRQKTVEVLGFACRSTSCTNNN